MKKAARAKNTKARGEASPEAELGAEVLELDPAADDVCEPLELDPELLVFDAVEEDLALEVAVELLAVVLVTVAAEADEADEDEAPEEVAAAADETTVTPPINWNCVL